MQNHSMFTDATNIHPHMMDAKLIIMCKKWTLTDIAILLTLKP